MRRSLGSTGEGVKVLPVEPKDRPLLPDSGDAADTHRPGRDVSIERADRHAEVLCRLLPREVWAVELGE